MADINVLFTRSLMSSVHADIREAFPSIRPMRDASVVGPHGRNQYFVQIHAADFPAFDDYYNADNAYEARAKAWMKFFDKYAPEQIKRRAEARNADRVDGYDRDNLGESPDY